MALGGLAALLFGVHAERVPLENIATPLAVVDAEHGESGADGIDENEVSPRRRHALGCRERAEEERARAAEHRATGHDLRAAANGGAHRADREPYHVEEVLAQIAELRAESLEERASSYDELAMADETSNTNERRAAIERALAARERSRASDEHVEALSAEHRQDQQLHQALAEAASERAYARDERALAEQARADAARGDEASAAVARAQVATHEQWSQMHLERASVFAAHAHGDRDVAEHERAADTDREQALGAADRLDALRHHASAARLETEEGAIEQRAERERRAHERDERIRERLDRQRRREWTGLRRFLPGPGSTFFSPGMIGTASRWAPTAEQDLDREISVIARALDERGTTDRDDLAELVGARFWGPGRFRIALREAVNEGRAQRLSRTTFGPLERPGDPA
jgi:hypothetical protein